MAEPHPVDTPRLVDLARQGDVDAWRELFNAYAGRLVLWLRQLPTGDPGVDADDLAMEAWALAASRIADFHGDDHDFAGWLFTIARNHAINARRRTSRRATFAADELPDTPDPSLPEDALASEEAVRAALRSLPQREGEVIACIDIAGLDAAETGRVLGISPHGVRIARRRGLARLRTSGWPV